MGTFYFPPDFRFSFGSPRDKFDDNLKAIQLVKQLESENRLPNEDEQEVLARYVGFGDSQVMKCGEYMLDEQLEESELKSLKASTLNAHYTDLDIIRAIWEGLLHLGLEGMNEINVLDPSAGIGHFLSCMPKQLRESARVVEVELDQITGKILQYLHPDAAEKSKVYVMGFEKTPIADQWFDLAISNVPFGDYAIVDRSIKDHTLRAAIHDYFFARALKAVKPGGIIAFITSRYTLDKKDSKVREYIARRAELLTAVRLPRGTFKKNAGTDVVTDLIVLRKRAQELGEEDPLPNWFGTQTLQIPQHRWDGDDDCVEHAVNAWFMEHPNLVIGKFSLFRGQFSPTDLEVVYDDDDIAEQLRQRLISGNDALPANLLLREPVVVETEEVDEKEEREKFTDEYAILISSKATDGAKAQLQKLRDIHKTAKELLNTEVAGRDPGKVALLRDLLNRQYDDYLLRYGPINKESCRKLLANSPAAPFLMALEKNFDIKRNTSEKADIFLLPTLRGGYRSVKIETAQDALLVCLGEIGHVDIPYIAALAGMEEEKVITDLDGLIYRDPDTNEWTTAEQYLSGNVREKLVRAHGAAKMDKVFERNIQALEESLPRKLKPSEVKVNLGAMWIPVELVQEFIYFLLPGSESADIRIQSFPSLATWKLECYGSTYNLPKYEMGTKYGTSRMTALEIIDRILNSQATVVYDQVTENGKDKAVVNKTETVAAQEKKAVIEAAFQNWIWADPERAERMMAIYNEKVNVYRRPTYNGSHLKLPGLSWGVPVAPYQLNAIWRAVQSQTMLFGHDVGLGKTRMAVISIMESIRLGRTRKAMVVCPNQTVGQWQAEVLAAYPTANVLCATPEDLAKFDRQEFMSRIATGAWDVVIVPMSSFKSLPVGPEVEERFIELQKAELEIFLQQLKDEGAGYKSRKIVEKALKNFEAKLDALSDMKKDSDKVVTWEQLGVDLLVVDELQYFKNLFFTSKMSNVAGVPHNKTERAWDMFIKIRYLLDHGGRFFGATATPLTNSVAEVFVMQEYLQYEELQKMGFGQFDNWAKTFAEPVTALEMTADGAGFQLVTRLSHFINVFELSAMFGQVFEAARWKDIPPEVVHRPGLYQGKPTVIVTPGSEYLRTLIASLAKRAEKIKAGLVTPDIDNMLLVTTDGRKAALDINLVDPGLPEPEYNKISTAADLIARIYHDTEKWKSVQLVFSDLGTPSSEKRHKDKRRKKSKEDTSRPVVVDRPAVQDEDVVPQTTVAKEVDLGDVKELDETEVAEVREQDEVDRSPVQVDTVALGSLYSRFKKKLVERGVREEQVAFIHDARNLVERTALFEKVRTGKIRVLVGSTEKMGTGMNVQTRVIALHHLDAPWRPADITQREGRMLRQGNRYPEAFVFTYITDASPDGFIWQKLESKNASIEQFMFGMETQRELEIQTDSTMTIAQIKAWASGNHELMVRTDVQGKVLRYEHLRASWLDNQQELKRNVKSVRVEIDGLGARLTALAKAKEMIDQTSSDDQFRMTVGQNQYTERKDAGEALKDAAAKVRTLALHERGRVERMVGSFLGFRLIVRSFPPSQITWSGGAPIEEEILLDFGDPIRLVAHVGATGLGTVQSIEAVLRGTDELIRKDQEHRDSLSRQLVALEEGLTKPWEYEKEYIKRQRQLLLLDMKLMHAGVDVKEINGGEEPSSPDANVDVNALSDEDQKLLAELDDPNSASGDNMIKVIPLEGRGRDSWIDNSSQLGEALARIAELHADLPEEKAVEPFGLFVELANSTASENSESVADGGGQLDLFRSVTASEQPMEEGEDKEIAVQVAPARAAISLLQDDSGPLPIEAWLTVHPAATPAPRRKRKVAVVEGQISLF